MSSTEKQIEGDRGIPSVKQNSDYTRIYAFLFLAVGAAAIIFVIMDGMKDSAPKKMTDAQEETFQTYSGNAGPYIDDPIIEPPQEVLSQPVQETVPAHKPIRALDATRSNAHCERKTN